jgi:uridine monophosphate synthetase
MSDIPVPKPLDVDRDSPEILTESQERIADVLFDIGAVRFGDFRLKLHDRAPEAPLSPVYIDLRVLRRFPEAKGVAIDAYVELLCELKFDLLADVPTAATPLVSTISDRMDIGMITPRTDKKTHGTGAKVDGLLAEDAGMTAVVIDDLITTAGSKLEAVDILRANGLVVNDVVVLIDREQGGGEQLSQNGLQLHSVLTMNQMLEHYRASGRIFEDQYEDALNRLDQLNQFLGI